MLSTYTKQLTEAKSVLEGIKRFRGDCPFCGSKNTYSVVDMRGTIMWNCFSAACKVGGATEDIRLATVEDMFSKKEKTPPKPRNFTPPPYFQSIVGNMEATAYLKSVNALDAQVGNWTNVKFDPKLNRVVFYFGTAAVGRALVKTHELKWYRYDKFNRPYIVHCKGTPNLNCVIVEDAASACNVAHFADGVALLGTSLTDATKLYLQAGQWQTTTICLDPDAAGKAIEMCRELCAIIKGVRIINLTKDPKEYEWGELRTLIYGRHSGTKTA